MANIIDVLKERGFIENLTSDGISKLTEKPTRVYCGFDPTADSLHLGNLVAIMGLAWFQRFGHTPVAVMGGATGMIGDPAGKNTARQLLDQKTLEYNLKGITKNLETILDFHHRNVKPIILNNFDWHKNFSFIQFLREVGSLFRIGPMLAKESVRLRLQSEEGMSFTEFSYQILQGYDFLYLFQHYGVTIQLGGSDQWGNIISGTDLIRKVLSQPAYGITFPLLTRSDGQKFGKSEKGAIWLSPEKLSSYDLYQYLVRVEDADVIKLMRMLTFMDIEEIRYYERQMQEPNYVPWTSQKRLAEEVVRLVRGSEALQTAVRVVEGFAPGSQAILDAETLENLPADTPSCQLPLKKVIDAKLIDLLVELGLRNSKGEIRRLLRNGGIYINNKKIEDENCVIDDKYLINNSLMLIAVGKKNKILVRIQKS